MSVRPSSLAVDEVDVEDNRHQQRARTLMKRVTWNGSKELVHGVKNLLLDLYQGQVETELR